MALAKDLREGRGAVVLGHDIVVGRRGHEGRFVFIEVGFVDRVGEAEDVLAGLQRDVLFADGFGDGALAAGETQAAGDGGLGRVSRVRHVAGAGLADHGANFKRLALADVGGQRDAFDRDFGACAEFDGHDIDADAVGGEQLRDRFGIADVFVAVGDDDDAARGVFGEGGLGQLHGGGQVRGVLAEIKDAFELSDEGQVRVHRRDFDVGLAAENDQRRAVAPQFIALRADRLADILHHRVALLRGDAGRLVQQVDDGHAVAGTEELGFGQREHQAGEDERAEDDGEDLAAPPESAEAAKAQRPQQRQQ